jgi:hypothetical protein
MKTIELGTVTISYNEDGSVNSVVFSPTEIDFFHDIGGDFMGDLLRSGGSGARTEDKIKADADTVLAAYFSQLNYVELADRDKYVIDSKVTECSKYDNGNVKSCSMLYTFHDR